jgi:HlyD family secretion protein
LSVDGTIELERLKDVLKLGRPAFGQANQTIGMFVLTADGTEAVRTPVRLGRNSVSTVEILEGLKEGDRVIISDTSAQDSYNRVRLR